MNKFTTVSAMHDMPILTTVSNFKFQEDFSYKPQDITTKYLGVMGFGITFYANGASLQNAVKHAQRSVYNDINRKALLKLRLLKGIAYKYCDPELEMVIAEIEHYCTGGE
jgi:hypothetical protein